VPGRISRLWRTSTALDDERVLVLIQFSGRGNTSGLEAQQIRTEGLLARHNKPGAP
jgi:hypothetical protein